LFISKSPKILFWTFCLSAKASKFCFGRFVHQQKLQNFILDVLFIGKSFKILFWVFCLSAKASNFYSGRFACQQWLQNKKAAFFTKTDSEDMNFLSEKRNDAEQLLQYFNTDKPECV